MNQHERMKASDFPQELLEIFDGYVHGRMSKRDFLDRAGAFTVAGLSGAALIKALQPNYAWAEQVKPDDARIAATRLTYPSPHGNGTIKALMVKPAGSTGRLPGVVVVHENRGLNPYIEDVARRVALAGYVALAPDGLSPFGGYLGDDEKGAELQMKVDPAKLMEDFFAGFEFLSGHEATNGKVAGLGFCYGGGVVNAMAVAFPKLAAGVAFYGRQPTGDDVAKITAPLQLHYAALDTFIMPGWPAFEAALKANHKTYEAYIYPNVNHGFHNDTTPRYDEAAATLAWSRTLAFFKTYLG
ncbi:MAG: YghX family hydrolase [Ancalomicrobiaceae bacterium]|nr:YghX family hydrolase [Ancalomicrobiaceae bacterium]